MLVYGAHLFCVKIGSGSGKWVFLNHLDFFIYQSILFILRDHTYYMVNSYHAKGNRNKIIFDMTKKLKIIFFKQLISLSFLRYGMVMQRYFNHM